MDVDSQILPFEGRSNVKGVQRLHLFTKLKTWAKRKGEGVEGRRGGREQEQKLLFLRSMLFLTQGTLSTQVVK